ncbi:Glycerol uptake facilitator protein [Fulvivirga imtechensis AK7]|uniref:Glycerol uptake facilitator protein n=1 Tax=Fulvivirga imtechensis AK7 TaxID=1237149 RepID=L8JV74_9BACT|nr:MIP/aquaporin family protein [Fulvivirga imtechensis]ELR71494.1 Glycerol uptake facilitator protein [Fulvivirga imtechensis AK7]
MSVYLGEFLGTMLLIILGGGVVAGAVLKGTKSEGAGWLVIVVAWGLAVAFAIYAVGNISAAHINPAVTLALAFIGEFPWEMVPGYVISQTLGALAGASLVWLHYLPHWGNTDDPAAKLAVFSTAPAARCFASNFISEMIATMILVMGILFVGANEFTEGLNPLVIGGLVMVIGLGLGGTTGFAINPARDLGPRIAHWLLPIKGKGSSDFAYAWIPVAGPILGGMLGAALYKIFFQQEYTIAYGVVSAISVFATIYAVIVNYKTKIGT